MFSIWDLKSVHFRGYNDGSDVGSINWRNGKES